MEIRIKYTGLEDRQIKVKKQEAKGLRMLFDNFDPDWESGDEPYGTMTFTDEPSSEPEPIEPGRDIFAELDALKTEIEKLKAKLKKI